MTHPKVHASITFYDRPEVDHDQMVKRIEDALRAAGIDDYTAVFTELLLDADANVANLGRRLGQQATDADTETAQPRRRGRHPSGNIESTPRRFACPACGAGTGELCRTKSGRASTTSHSQRVLLAQRAGLLRRGSKGW